MTTPTHGLLISFEGIDGAGKTTVLQSLATQLRTAGHRVVVTKEPGGTFIGTMLKKVLLEEKKELDPRVEFLLFAADRAEHFKRLVIPALEEGAIVLSDRMADSAIAYQGFGRGLPVSFITHVNQFAMRDVSPHCTFYLRLPYEVALARRAQRNEQESTMEKEAAQFWQRVIAGYEHIAATNPACITLDATQSADVLLARVSEQVATLLDAVPAHARLA